MRIAILGAGAMGLVFGSRLHEAGYDVTLIDVSETLKHEIRTNGVAATGADGQHIVHVPSTTDAPSVGVVDVLLFFVKCYQTANAILTAGSLIGDQSLVVSLQNGWGNGDVLAEAYGANRTVVGVTYNSATVCGTAAVVHTSMGPTFVGPFTDTELDALRPFVGALAAAGFETIATANVRREIWKKLVLNAATLPTAALTRLTGGELLSDVDMTVLVDGIAKETVDVARSQGVELDAAREIELIHMICERVGTGEASMLQDVEAGRRTEIDVITGAVVRVGEEHGISVPYNRCLYAVIKGYERAYGLR